MSNGSVATPVVKKSIFENFIAGCKKGWNVWVNNMMPAIVMAYVLTQILTVTGCMELLSKYCGPVMAIFGLPGVAIVALVAGFFSKGGGCASAFSLYSAGSLTAIHCTMLLPAIILFGGLLGQWVRIVCVAGVPTSRQKWMFAVAFFDAFLALWVMKLLLMFL